MPNDPAEFTALSAEVALLRSDLDRARARLDLPYTEDRREGESEWVNMEFKQVGVRHSWKQIPLVLYTDTDESGVFLYDARQRRRGRFGVDADGQARLEIFNAEGKVAVCIGEGEAGRGEIRVNAADGTPRAGVKASEHGGALSVVDAQGKPLAAVISTDEGGLVFVCTPGRNAAVTLKSTPEGGVVVLAEPGGQAIDSFTVTSPGSALTVYGEHGSPAVTVSGLGELGGTLVFFTWDGEVTTMLP